jgi:hypothetical protein
VRHTVIDGYNLLFREREPTSSDALAGLVEDFLRKVDAARLPGQRVCVVFDGRPGAARPAGSGDDLEVVYSSTPRSADDLIVSIVSKAPRGSVTVLTYDRELIHRVRRAGGTIADPARFFEPPARRKKPRRSEKPPPPSGLELDAWEALFEERPGGEEE